MTITEDDLKQFTLTDRNHLDEQLFGTFAALRDTLLPRLLSGAVAVGDAEGVIS